MNFLLDLPLTVSRSTHHFVALFLCLAFLTAWEVNLQSASVEQQTFNSPQEAVDALVAAAKSNSSLDMQPLFGPEGQKLISPDAVQASQGFKLFVDRLVARVKLVKRSDTSYILQIGLDDWPFPIPLVKSKDHWLFDTEAGRSEILARRIGMDELGVIKVCQAYVVAQREYASHDELGDGVMAYAQFLCSTPGMHDGLFWPAKPNEPLSPLGPFIAQARVEGYNRAARMMNDQVAPYHGYYFRILTAQGRHAPGGEYSYLINGRMLAGFALIAWPAQWGNTGVMTFIVSQQGKVWQKNLGPQTAEVAKRMTVYDPDSTWTPAQ